MKKRKLNSKNPKYMDKSLLKEPKIKKKVYGYAEIRDASTKETQYGIGGLRVTAV